MQALRGELLDGRPAAVVLADDLGALNDIGVVFDASEGCAVVGCADGELVVGDDFERIEGVDLTRPLGRARSGREAPRLSRTARGTRNLARLYPSESLTMDAASRAGPPQRPHRAAAEQWRRTRPPSA